MTKPVKSITADMDKLLPVIRNRTPYVVVDDTGRIARAGGEKKTLERFAKLGGWNVMATEDYARACGLSIVNNKTGDWVEPGR